MRSRWRNSGPGSISMTAMAFQGCARPGFNNTAQTGFPEFSRAPQRPHQPGEHSQGSGTGERKNLAPQCLASTADTCSGVTAPFCAKGPGNRSTQGLEIRPLAIDKPQQQPEASLTLGTGSLLLGHRASSPEARSRNFASRRRLLIPILTITDVRSPSRAGRWT